MKRKILLFAVCIFFSAWSSITAQENNDKNEIVESEFSVQLSDESAVIIGGDRFSLPEMIIKAIELNPEIYIARYNVAMSDTDEMKYNSKYSAIFNGGTGVSSITNPEFLYSDYGKKNDSLDVSASLVKNFSTGTIVAAGIAHTKTSLDSGYGTEYDISNPVVFASIEQEFLRNSFGFNDRKQQKIFSNVTGMRRDAYVYSISMIAFQVITDYWNVVLSRNSFDNARIMLSETKKVRRIVAEKVHIGLSEQFEINYWNSLVSSSNASVAQAEQNYRNALRKLLRDVNVEAEISMEQKVILSDKLPVINTDEALKRAFEKRTDYLMAVKSLENAKLSLKINENNALPSLKGSVSVSSMDYNTDSMGDAYSNTASMKYPKYEARVNMTYPLDDTGQKAEERNAGWIVENLEKTRRYVRDDVITKIENIQTYYHLYGEAMNAREQAELYYRNMLTSMRRGRFAASSVRDALDALINSRESELRLLVAYNASLIEFEVSKNELFDTYGIDINKYIPE